MTYSSFFVYIMARSLSNGKMFWLKATQGSPHIGNKFQGHMGKMMETGWQVIEVDFTLNLVVIIEIVVAAVASLTSYSNH